MRGLWVMILAGWPLVAGAQAPQPPQAPDRSEVRRIKLCAVEGRRAPHLAVEIVNGRVRMIVSRGQDGVTDVFDFFPVSNSPNRAVELVTYRESGLPGRAASRFQQAMVQEDGRLILERWDFFEERAPSFQQLTIACQPD